MEGFSEVGALELQGNVFDLIGKRWMLITAGTPSLHNTMTASWGGLGVLWERNVCFAFVRPTRHTYGFMERHELFTLSFFPEEYRDALRLCGTRSGRDLDKAKAAGISPVATPQGSVGFAEASLVMECRKIYAQDVDPKLARFPQLEGFYPQKDYHRMYIGELISCFRRGT